MDGTDTEYNEHGNLFNYDGGITMATAQEREAMMNDLGMSLRAGSARTDEETGATVYEPGPRSNTWLKEHMEKANAAGGFTQESYKAMMYDVCMDTAKRMQNMTKKERQEEMDKATTVYGLDKLLYGDTEEDRLRYEDDRARIFNLVESYVTSADKSLPDRVKQYLEIEQASGRLVGVDEAMGFYSEEYDYKNADIDEEYQWNDDMREFNRLEYRNGKTKLAQRFAREVNTWEIDGQTKKLNEMTLNERLIAFRDWFGKNVVPARQKAFANQLVQYVNRLCLDRIMENRAITGKEDYAAERRICQEVWDSKNFKGYADFLRENGDLAQDAAEAMDDAAMSRTRQQREEKAKATFRQMQDAAEMDKTADETAKKLAEGQAKRQEKEGQQQEKLAEQYRTGETQMTTRFTKIAADGPPTVYVTPEEYERIKAAHGGKGEIEVCFTNGNSRGKWFTLKPNKKLAKEVQGNADAPNMMLNMAAFDEVHGSAAQPKKGKLSDTAKKRYNAWNLKAKYRAK